MSTVDQKEMYRDALFGPNRKGIGGRPKQELDEKDWEFFEAMCGIQCTKLEICAALGIKQDTLERRIRERYGAPFTEVFDEKKLAGNVSLRRKLWRQSDKNPTALIWACKQYLGQREPTQNLNHAVSILSPQDQKTIEAEVINLVDEVEALEAPQQV